MKKIFTKMASILIGLASMSVPMMGQRVELRSYEACYKGDSAITFTGAGVKVSKRVFRDGAKGWRVGDIYSWENNSWVLEDYGVTFMETEMSWFAPKLYIPMLGSMHYVVNYENKTVTPVQDAAHRLISLTVADCSGCDPYLIYKFTYNKNSAPLQVEEQNHDRKWTYSYQYDERGNGISFEHLYFGSNSVNDRKIVKMTCLYDAQGRPTLLSSYNGHETLQQWVLDWYEIYYYSEGRTPAFSIANSSPVTDSNKGLFDFIFNMSADSLQSGSFTVQLPSGFTLDAANTKLAAPFDAFTLSVTKQNGNAWLFEINPKSIRNAALRSDEADKTLAQIAYTVDGAVKRGTYNVSISNIQFETPGGNMIPEPVITVPINVNRWGVGNESLADVADVWSRVGRLHVRTSQTLTLNIYTLSGTLLKQQTVAAGETVIPLPQGAYIVQAGKTVKKTVIR